MNNDDSGKPRFSMTRCRKCGSPIIPGMTCLKCGEKHTDNPSPMGITPFFERPSSLHPGYLPERVPMSKRPSILGGDLPSIEDHIMERSATPESIRELREPKRCPKCRKVIEPMGELLGRCQECGADLREKEQSRDEENDIFEKKPRTCPHCKITLNHLDIIVGACSRCGGKLEKE